MNNLVMLTSYLMLPRQFAQYFFNFKFLVYVKPVCFPKHHKRISFSSLLEYLQVQRL